MIASSRPGVAEPLSSERSCLVEPVFSLLRLHERSRHCRVTGCGRAAPGAPSSGSPFAGASAGSGRRRSAAAALQTLVPINRGTCSAITHGSCITVLHDRCGAQMIEYEVCAHLILWSCGNDCSTQQKVGGYHAVRC